MSTPLVSVNMAAYNAAAYITEAIQSVINQTYQNWELIIINNCSTDNTVGEISKFKDNRIKVFHNEINEGIVYSRNRALHYSQGKYIAILDADDVFLPEKLAIQVDFLEKNDNYGMVGTGFRFIDEKSNFTSDVKCWYAKAEHFPAILLFNNFFVHSTTMFRTYLAKEILYKPLISGYSPAEDYQLFVEIARNHKIYNMDIELAYYRENNSGVSKVREDKINEFIDQIICKQLTWLHISPDKEELILHKSIRFAYDNLEFTHIRKISKWMKLLAKQNKIFKVYDCHFEEYLAAKWYEIAKFNASYGLKMLLTYYSSTLSLKKNITREQRNFLTERCLYEFKKGLIS